MDNLQSKSDQSALDKKFIMQERDSTKVLHKLEETYAEHQRKVESESLPKEQQ